MNPPSGGRSTGTGTRTETRTETRTTQLARQLNLFVATVTGSTSFLEVILRGAEERWIREVIVTLLGDDEKIRHEATLSIDWEDHSMAMARSDKGVISERRFDPKTGWLGAALSELAGSLVEIAREGRLTAQWSVRYTAEAQDQLEKVRAELGLTPRANLEWADGTQQVLWSYSDIDLHEVTATWKGVLG
jgi:hypothetical protein